MSGFLIGAFAIIFGERDEALLCLPEDLNIWNLPGGRVKQGDSPWEAVESGCSSFEEVPNRSNQRPVEMVLDARDNRGETVRKTQAGPFSRKLTERGLL